MLTDLTVVTLVYVLLPLVTVGVALALMVWIRRRAWDRRGAKEFVWMLLAQQVWMLAVVFHILLTDLVLQSLFGVLGFVAATISMALFVVFVSRYSGLDYHRRPPFALAIAAFPGSLVLLWLTNDFHELLFQGEIVHTEPFHYVSADVGPGILIVFGIGFPLLLYSAYVIFRHIDRKHLYSDLQVVLLLLAMIPIGLIQLLGSLGIFPATDLAHATYGALPFNIMATIALFWVGLFEVQPLARSRILDDLQDAVLLLDADGEVVDCNDAALEQWPTLDHQVGEPLERIDPDLARAADIPDTANDETTVTIETDGGEPRHYTATLSPLRRGSADWTAVLLRDITEIERSREALERQNERLDQVASTISHDLRNPIQIADGYADLLEADVATGDLAAADERIEEIRDAIDRMDAIIEDVLTLARQGTTVVDPEPVSLETAAKTAWSNVETSSATLEVEDGTLEADRDRLLTVFENLFRNAVEHGGPDPTVTVRPTETGFAVEDDGSGIDPNAADEVFAYGYTTETDGTGLGLSIVRTMAEAHGWSVRLAPEADGARFVFRT